MAEPRVQKHLLTAPVPADADLGFQIWTGAKYGLEIHFVVTGPDGALCFRTGGGQQDAMRIHWLDEDRSEKKRTMEQCPLLDDRQCWIDPIDQTMVETAGRYFEQGADQLWQYLLGSYMEITRG